MKRFLFQTSHFLSIISIIVIILSVSLTIFYNEYFKSKYLEEQEKINFKNEVYQIAKKIINCLGWEKEGTFYIDKNKLDEYSMKYNEIEPRCAVAENFDYRVNVIQFEKEIRNYPFYEEKREGGIAEEILKETNNNKIIFVLDVSGSMSAVDTPPCDGKKYNSADNSRICCLKRFMLYFLENYGRETEIGINIFGVGVCGVNWILSPYWKISENNTIIKDKILKLSPLGNTPILKGLWLALEKASNNSYIVLLTDGGENCYGIEIESVIRKIREKNISLLSIGFGAGADINFLNFLANNVNGKVYEAKNCEELISEKSEYFEEKMIKSGYRVWNFSYLPIGPEIYYETSISLPILIKYNETHIVDGLLVVNAYKGFLESFYSFIDSLCNKNLKEFEVTKKFYFDYDVKVYKDKICSENVCKRLVCDYEVEEKEFKKGENIIRVLVENNKIKFV